LVFKPQFLISFSISWYLYEFAVPSTQLAVHTDRPGISVRFFDSYC